MSSVLVLNSDYSPLNVTSLKRGFVLVDKGKAEIIKKGDTDIITTIGNFARPIIIRLLDYIKYRPKTIKVNRKKILKRDRYACQYCGSKRNLTIDHVIPRSKGGKNTWGNLVSCCFRCNSKKGDKTLSESGMKLKSKPYTPNLFSNIVNEDVENIWNDFIKKIYK